MSKKSEMLEACRQAIKENPNNRGLLLRIKMPNGEIEVSCNPRASSKLDYIDQTYNDNLEHNNNNKIRIIGYEVMVNKDIPIGFGMVIDIAKAGHKIRRKTWEEGLVAYAEDNKFQTRNKSEVVKEWTPTQEDMFATDYEIVKG